MTVNTKIDALSVSLVDQHPCELLLLGINDLIVETRCGLGLCFCCAI